MNKKIKFLVFFVSCFFVISLTPKLIYPQESTDKQVIESLEFRDVDIKDVLRQLAKQYNLNIVFSEKVTGLITVQLNKVTLDEALDSIITINGFVYTRSKDVIKVTTAEEADKEGKQTKLFKLNNADGTKLQVALSKVLTPSGSIQVDTRSNSIVVTDSLSVINKIQAMIPDLDAITPQVLIEARLIETTLNTFEKLGIDWSTTMKVSGSSRKVTWPFNAMSAHELQTFLPEDQPPSSTSSSSSSSSTTSSATFPGNRRSAFPFTVPGDFSFGTLDFSSLSATLDFLKSRSKTKLIANPRLVTTNNQKASINVGQVLSLPTYERNATTGVMEITGWTPMNVGINLEVTPQISPDGHIKMDIKPEVSSLIGYASTRSGVNEGPITSTRTAQTEVLIRDGQTVVIGGLVKDESLITRTKIPILGDIPLIGLLFSRKNISTQANPSVKTDLLIFVTAHIIKDSPEPLIGRNSYIITSQPRPFKMEAREVK